MSCKKISRQWRYILFFSILVSDISKIVLQRQKKWALTVGKSNLPILLKSIIFCPRFRVHQMSTEPRDCFGQWQRSLESQVQCAMSPDGKHSWWWWEVNCLVTDNPVIIGYRSVSLVVQTHTYNGGLICISITHERVLEICIHYTTVQFVQGHIVTCFYGQITNIYTAIFLPIWSPFPVNCVKGRYFVYQIVGRHFAYFLSWQGGSFIWENVKNFLQGNIGTT